MGVPFLGNKGIVPVEFADDGLQSTPIELKGLVPIGIVFGAAWVSATLSFKASYDNVTYFDLTYDNAGAASAVTLTGCAASKFLCLDPTKFLPCPWLKVVSSAAQSGGPLALQIVLKNI